jgi:rapamycin-insensitive companion of mTOR
LASHGWNGTVNMLGESLGYCLPLEFTKLFDVSLFLRHPSFA